MARKARAAFAARALPGDPRPRSSDRRWPPLSEVSDLWHHRPGRGPRERVRTLEPDRVLLQRTGDTVQWDSDLIRALRHHMGMGQSELAEQLGVRQQTISEWETGSYAPKRAMSKYLMIIAEQAGFTYGAAENNSQD